MSNKLKHFRVAIGVAATVLLGAADVRASEDAASSLAEQFTLDRVRVDERPEGHSLLMIGRIAPATAPAGPGGAADPDAVATSVVTEVAAVLDGRLDAPEWRMAAGETDGAGWRHVSFRQVVGGLEVEGTDVRVHVAPGATTAASVNGFIRDLSDEALARLRSVAGLPALADSQLRAVVEAHAAQAFGGASVREWVRGQRLLSADEPTMVFVASVLVDAVGLVAYRLDARTGEVLEATRQINDGHQGEGFGAEVTGPDLGEGAAEAQGVSFYGTGTGVQGNTRNHIDTTFENNTFRLYDQSRRAGATGHSHGGQMQASAAIETRYDRWLIGDQDMTDSDNSWTDRDQAAAVDAQVLTAAFYDWSWSVLGLNGADGIGSTMRSVVDADDSDCGGSDNALYNGAEVRYCEPVTRLSLAGDATIVAHEWGHAITRWTSTLRGRGVQLEYVGLSGALNEAFSDLIGVAFARTQGRTDWLIGWPSSPFRQMSNPNAYWQPDRVGGTYWVEPNCGTPSRQNDQCGVHTNSGVPNKAFYNLAQVIGLDTTVAIALAANRYYWPERATFLDARDGMVQAAQAWGSTTVRAVEQAWADVGVGSVSVPGFSLSWVTPPPSSVAAGSPFVVAFTTNGGTPSHANIHWDPTDPKTATCCFGAGDTTSSSTYSNGSRTITLNAPTRNTDGSSITTPTIVRYVAHARLNDQVAWSDVVAVNVSPAGQTEHRIVVDFNPPATVSSGESVLFVVSATDTLGHPLNGPGVGTNDAGCGSFGPPGFTWTAPVTTTNRQCRFEAYASDNFGLEGRVTRTITVLGTGSARETACADGRDDDGDGATDCDDSDCSTDPACSTPAREDCANGVDDDGDGAADCDDSDCAAAPACGEVSGHATVRVIIGPATGIASIDVTIDHPLDVRQTAFRTADPGRCLQVLVPPVDDPATGRLRASAICATGMSVAPGTPVLEFDFDIIGRSSVRPEEMVLRTALFADTNGAPLSVPAWIDLTHGCPVPGDVAPRNAPDGVVNVADAVLYLRHSLGLDPMSDSDLLCADIAPVVVVDTPDSGPRRVRSVPDGRVDVSDAVIAIRIGVELDRLE